MNLRTYLEQDPARVAELSAAMGVHWTTIYRWARGENVPSVKRITQITAATKGAVTAADFVAQVGAA